MTDSCFNIGDASYTRTVTVAGREFGGEMKADTFSQDVGGVIEDVRIEENGAQARHIIHLELPKILNLLANGDTPLLEMCRLQHGRFLLPLDVDIQISPVQRVVNKQ